MRTWKILFLFLCSTLCAAEWDESLFYASATPPPFYPFSFSGSYVDVQKTHFRTPAFEDQTLHYRQWETALAYTHAFSSKCGLIFGAGWVGTEVNMTNNPEFDEKIFNYINFSLGAFTKTLPDWTWTLTFSAFFDMEVFSLIDYSLYQGILWGKYSLCKNFELDFGVIVEAGLKKTKVWPILGFVYTPFECLRLYAIYPINISLEYDVTKCLIAAVSVRFLRNRHRLKQTEFDSQGIFEYRSTGAEANLTFRPFRWISFKGFVGSTFGGDFTVADRNDDHTTHFKFKSSLYYGASGVLSF